MEERLACSVHVLRFSKGHDWHYVLTDDRLVLVGFSVTLLLALDAGIRCTRWRFPMHQILGCLRCTGDRFPKYKNNQKLVFGSCEDSEEIWVPLLEKAFAKLHGNYESLISGV